MSEKELIREAFSKAKQDIRALKDQISQIFLEVKQIKKMLSDNPTDDLQNTSEYSLDSNNPTDDWPYKRLKPHVYSISTGNDGVPTNKPTIQQTNQQSIFPSEIDRIEHLSEVLESLDTIKKDLRSKFKHLTKQEMLVFSTLYQLQEEGFTVDYSLIAKKLALSEPSIRDYIQRVIKKGIPIQKTKENNKKVFLTISSEFRQIASLQTILQLREL